MVRVFLKGLGFKGNYFRQAGSAVESAAIVSDSVLAKEGLCPSIDARR
ncbi:MAG: hypothetical protein QOE77_2594 [Blastocatellia bacterium]|jgi:hypothetical protein|nr:hypothetical protein [Blastocatellia bacterium]